MLPRPLPLLCCILLVLRAAAQAPTPPVIDWKAPATLPTYLLQQVHAQYAPRRAELDKALSSAAGTQAYRDSARARFRRVLGPLPARTPLRARVVGTVPQAGFVIEKVVYESMPHHHVTANLYIPAGKGKRPAALLFCGHEQASKATPSYQLTARLLARNGFVVLVIDPVSQGERMQLVDAGGKPLTRGGTTEHTLLNAQATLLGTNLPAEELWDNVRSLDYLLTRPEVDAARVGCLGNSGGATQTAYFMAYDDRVQAAALCSYVAAGERNLIATGPADGCVMLPGAGAAGLDVADWLIMFAPKPLLLLTGRYDFVDQTDMEAAHADTRRAYAALGAADKTDVFTYDDGHGISAPKRAAAVAWLRRWLGAGGPAVAEGADQPLPEAALRCIPTGQVATAFKDEQSLAALHLATAQALARARPAYSPEALAQVVGQQLGLRQPPAKTPVGTGIEVRDTLRQPGGLAWQGLLLRRDQEPPLPARLLLPAPGAPAPTRLVLWLPGQGMATVLRDSATRLAAYQRQGTAVLLADLRGLGETTDLPAFNDPKYYNQEYRPALLALHLGRPLLAQRVADVSTLLTLLRNEKRLWQLPILLRADGRAALASLHAALLSPRVSKQPFTETFDTPPPAPAPRFGPQIEQVQVSGGPPSFHYYLDNPAAKDAYSEVLPGVLRTYDVPDLRRALGSRLLP